MNDLISRNKAVEEIWNVFNEYANDGSKFDEYETKAINKAFTVLQNHINNLPIAYNVDKVVAGIEKQGYEVEIDDGSLFTRSHTVIDTYVAIAKVRKGGIE